MGRGVDFESTKYKLDMGLVCKVRTDKNWIGDTKLGNVEDDLVLDAHVALSKNRNQFGIHPRYVVLERTFGEVGDDCVLQNGSKKMQAVILSPERFEELEIYDAGNDGNANAKITLSHKPGGGGTLEWKVIKKVAERLV